MDANQKAQLIAQITNPVTFEPIAKDAFTAADKNGNGTIDRNELKLCMGEVAQGLGVSAPTKTAIDKEFKRLDTDKNGTIDFNEFKVFVSETMIKIINGL